MTTKQVAERLKVLCQEKKIYEAINELYAEDIMSIENYNFENISQGFERILQGNKEWFGKIKELHEIIVGEPIIAGNHFVFKMDIHATLEDGSNYDFEELCVYEVKDGKIVYEQFFYSN